MIFIVLIFLSALAVSGCAAWFSVAGLISIFSSAPLATGLMGGSLELAKLVAASWLYRNWRTAPVMLRSYFAIAVVVLSIITSLGIFGYLSKAHLDQSVITGQASSQLTVIDDKINIIKENIDVNRKALKQLDEAVDQVMARSTSETGATKAVQVRRSQAKERSRILQDIEADQKKLGAYNEDRAPLLQDVRRIEAEVGPIKYVAELIYTDSSEDNIGRAVRLVILMLIFVFDPLAILMVIAGNITIMERSRTPAVQHTVAHTEPVFEYEEMQSQVDADEVRLRKKDVHIIPPEILEKVFHGPRPNHPHYQPPKS